jgi:hypothetical protein
MGCAPRLAGERFEAATRLTEYIETGSPMRAHQNLGKNRLDHETSPYLLQHADNPVHWQPWDDAALAAARDTGRPILLSIGYSACHWCHVMAHESFEDPTTAELMNELFINIKVDREERPDLDHVYQTAHRVLAQRPGGWPLTVFLTPEDHTPFFAGTYFPREPRFGMPGFKDLMQRIHQAWTHQKDELEKQNTELRRAMIALEPGSSTGGTALDSTLIQQARRQLESDFDQDYGGFGSAPKFPRPASLAFLLRQSRERDAPAGRLLDFTLSRMAQGGLFDQLEGGFYRYSVDHRWEIPHFEKMLYDNGLLLGLYAEAWQRSGNPLFRQAATATADWMLHDMQAGHGGFCSSLDADTDGREGGYYVFTPDELDTLLGTIENREIVMQHFGLEREPNFEGEWHLNVHRTVAELAAGNNLDKSIVEQQIDAAKNRLRDLRSQRTRPGRDDKILTSWNALTISGLAQAGRIFDNSEWLDAAARALDFIRTELWQDGRLLACHKDGRNRFPAYLDDYANLGIALLDMLQARWRSEDLTLATQLADVLLERFENRKHGGFHFTADDHEKLIHRPRPFTDEATPSGNGIACQFLLRLGYLLAEPRYLDAAERCLHAGAESIKQMPAAHCAMLDGLRDYLEPRPLVVLRGESEHMAEWQQRLTGIAVETYAIPVKAELPESLAGKKPQGEVVAYVCRGRSCTAAIDSRDALIAELESQQ